MLIALTTIFLGIKKYRDKHLNGYISFGKSFLMGLYIALIASTLYVLTWMVISDLFLPDFMEKYVEAQIQALKDSGASAEEIEKQSTEYNSMAESYKNPIIKALYTYMEILPVGILIALISAAILRKKA